MKEKIWNIIIWVVAIILILISLPAAFVSLLVQDWNQAAVNGFIVLLVAYGLYRKFWRKKEIEEEKNVQENNKKNKEEFIGSK